MSAAQLLPWALVILLYAPLFLRLYQSRWKTVDYTHAYFILPVALWLAWRKRQQLKSLAVQIPQGLWGMVLLVLGLMVFLFGWRYDYMFVTVISLVPVLFGLVWQLYGGSVARAMAFPVLYLLLLVPPPLGMIDDVTLPMRYGMSVVTEWFLRALHYPVTREGLLLSIGKHDVFMGQACSGFRSLITMFSLGLIYASLAQTRTSKKVVLAVATIPFALLGNLVRVITHCLATYYLGEDRATGLFHYASGTLIFSVMIFGLVVLDRLLARQTQVA